MRLIDIDAFRKDFGLAERCEDCERDARECQFDQIYTRMDFCGWLDDAEIIDAVPVVRCENCRWHYDRDDDIICANSGDVVQKNDYCSYGVMRTDVD